jgi:hypothetical protein
LLDHPVIVGAVDLAPTPARISTRHTSPERSPRSCGAAAIGAIGSPPSRSRSRRPNISRRDLEHARCRGNARRRLLPGRRLPRCARARVAEHEASGGRTERVGASHRRRQQSALPERRRQVRVAGPDGPIMSKCSPASAGSCRQPAGRYWVECVPHQPAPFRGAAPGPPYVHPHASAARHPHSRVRLRLMRDAPPKAAWSWP